MVDAMHSVSLEVVKIVGLVLHFRTPKSTLDCVRSLFDEGVRCVVLVDNSEDAGVSLAEMDAELDRLIDAGLDVQVLAPDRNLGFARGVNSGLMRAVETGADAILLINSDAQLESGALISLAKHLGEAAVVVPRARQRKGAASRSLFGHYQAAFALVLRTRWPGCLTYATGCCLLMHSKAVATPLFDEGFFFYGEDVLLGLDFNARGVKVLECAEATVIHAGSGSAKNGSFFYEYHMNRGHWLLAHKLAPNTYLRTGYLAGRCLSLPLRALVRCFRFRSLIPFRGLVTATLDVARGRCSALTPPAG